MDRKFIHTTEFDMSMSNFKLILVLSNQNITTPVKNNKVITMSKIIQWATKRGHIKQSVDCYKKSKLKKFRLHSNRKLANRNQKIEIKNLVMIT